jgi:hypothetical protein
MEMTLDFNELDEDIQGSATLIHLALTKLQSNSAACILAQQGFVMYFNIGSIAHEDVGLATSWLKATFKNLSFTNDIPNTSLASVLSGMARSQSRRFNTYCHVLEVNELALVPKPHPGVDTSAAHYKVICGALDKLNTKYRDLLQNGQWPKAKTTQSSSSALVASPSDKPSPHKPRHSHDLDPDIYALVSRSNCFNPLCKSPDHRVKDCPGPFPKNWKHRDERGRSPSRDSSRDVRGSSRSNSRGPPRGRHSRDSSNGRSLSRGRSPARDTKYQSSRHRDQTPDARKSNLKNGVSFQANLASTADDDDESVASTYDASSAAAFLLRMQQSKD